MNENKNYWYAVLINEDDNDWGTGSYNLEEAKKEAIKYEDGLIEIIEMGTDPISIGRIRREDFNHIRQIDSEKLPWE